MSVPMQVWLGLGGGVLNVCEQCMYLLFQKLISQYSLRRSLCSSIFDLYIQKSSVV